MILITGGAGFIGSSIAADFHERNHDIVICDWLGQNDKWKNIQKLVPKDIIAPEALPTGLTGGAMNLPPSSTWAQLAPRRKPMPT